MKISCPKCSQNFEAPAVPGGKNATCPHCGADILIPPPGEPTLPQVTVLDVFVSSPGDVGPEREALIRTIERINRMPQIRDHYVLRPFRYEKEVAPDMGSEPQVIVDRACHVTECYLVICILWQRMGTAFTHPATQREYLSGTEYEFVTAYEAKKAGAPYPNILIYRKRNGSPGAGDVSQQAIVDQFFSRMEGAESEFKGLYWQFADLREFEDNALQHILTRIHESPPVAVPSLALPAIVEEERRLDVAVPAEVTPTDIVELWAKICLPDSKGLRNELPDKTDISGAPVKADTGDKFMSVAFERKPDSEELLPLATKVEVITNDFEVLEDERVVELIQGKDSPTIVFPLTVKTPGESAMVMVRVMTKSVHSDYWIENSSMVQRISVCREAKSEGAKPTGQKVESLQVFTLGVQSESGPKLMPSAPAPAVLSDQLGKMAAEDFSVDDGSFQQPVPSRSPAQMPGNAADAPPPPAPAPAAAKERPVRKTQAPPEIQTEKSRSRSGACLIVALIVLLAAIWFAWKTGWVQNFLDQAI